MSDHSVRRVLCTDWGAELIFVCLIMEAFMVHLAKSVVDFFLFLA